MTYQDFNKKILEFYLHRSTSTFCILSIDSQEFETIIPLEEISQFKTLTSSWHHLLLRYENTPQYFGLIAIQCLAASLMHNDGDNTQNAFQIRLLKLLGIKNNNALQILYRGHNIWKPIQEQIWHDAKIFLKNDFNLILEIPKQSQGAWRYVQYPKSQALLNTEDLKYFTQFFSQEFQIKEIILFEYFQTRLNDLFPNIKKNNRVINLWFDDDKREQCIKQVYNYYNLWEGEIYMPQSGNNYTVKTSLKKSAKLNQKLSLIFNNGYPSFYDDTQNLVRILEENSLIEKLTKRIIIFNELDSYQNEYEESSILYSNVKCYILSEKYLRPFESHYLENNNEDRIEIGQTKVLYKYKFEKNILISPLGKYFQHINPARLNGGLKINRGNDYLKDFGPSIISDSSYSVIYENYRCNYDSQTARAGNYKIRTDHFPNVEFNLIEKQQVLCTVESKNRGWNFGKYSIEKDFNIEGCCIKQFSMVKQEPIREWIDANLKSKNMKKYRSDNILIKAINNSR